MITTIKVQGPATFLASASLETDKKVNLIYGLNGTGKSTVCRFLKSPDSPDYDQCEIFPPRSASTIYVYNEDFVRENFYESEMLKGIFSLSKQNKEAETKISDGKKRRQALAADMEAAKDLHKVKNSELLRAKQIAEDASWKIKTDYAGGDRVLEYCLEGLKGKKETLFAYLAGVALPAKRPEYDIQSLKSEAQTLSSSDATLAAVISPIDIGVKEIETDEIFRTPIIGSQHSTVSDLIIKLGNSDWVREGLEFLEASKEGHTSRCPFCQAETLTDDLVNEIRKFFDESYERNLSHVKNYRTRYQAATEGAATFDEFKAHPFASEKFIHLIGQLHSILESNLLKIDSKVQNPSSTVELASSTEIVDEISIEIERINSLVTSHNEKLRDKEKSLHDVEARFWALMRWNHDQPISRFQNDQREINSALQEIAAKISNLETQIRAADIQIAEAQKQTVNVDEAVLNINHALINLGIEDFSIEKHDEALYRLKRSSTRGSSKFSTLSEGEKMIITLLYFCELCKDRRSTTDTTDDKIVVFDDPISSLSHIYIFNVGQLIRSTFFQSSTANQVFVFTHSLYFFYELADPKKERRDENQALFRITKSKGQSRFLSMKYEEIQNDYQAYWQVINNSDHHPALIANCMRNIVDYFFGFVEKLEYTSVFQKPSLKDNRFQAFSRYMNRESHSFGQNIYDLKEFDYESFKEGLRLVFEESGYQAHYKKMSKI